MSRMLIFTTGNDLMREHRSSWRLFVPAGIGHGSTHCLAPSSKAAFARLWAWKAVRPFHQTSSTMRKSIRIDV